MCLNLAQFLKTSAQGANTAKVACHTTLGVVAASEAAGEGAALAGQGVRTGAGATGKTINCKTIIVTCIF